jgi:hypothetical protein
LLPHGCPSRGYTRRRNLLGVLFLCAVSLASQGLAPLGLTAQETGVETLGSTQDPGFELHQNYPNPFSTSTRIPFTLGTTLFDDGQPVVVTMRIFNPLQQLVAYPTALRHVDGEVPVNMLEYPSPGLNEAFWDAHDLNGRQVSAGMYYLQITVNGRRHIMKMLVTN